MAYWSALVLATSGSKALFHVAQAVWQWRWTETHHIEKDRKQLMTELHRVMYCCDTDEAENAVQEAMNSETTV